MLMLHIVILTLPLPKIWDIRNSPINGLFYHLLVGKYLTYTVKDDVAVVKFDQPDAKVCQLSVIFNALTKNKQELVKSHIILL